MATLSFAKKDPASPSYRRDLGAGDVTRILYGGVTRGECACSCAVGALNVRDVRGGGIGGAAP